MKMGFGFEVALAALACGGLYGSGFAAAAPKRAIHIVLNGLAGPLTVNGKAYNSVMPPMSQLNDDELANILTYVIHSWDNKGTDAFSAAEIRTVRATTARPPGAAD